MPFSARSLLVPVIFVVVVCMSKSQLHASAFIIGTALWHSIFPASPGETEARKGLPSREKFLANLQVEPEPQGDQAKEDCPTCWHEINEPVRLICGHRFCKSCILLWLSGTSAADSCPICKMILFINTLPTKQCINQLAQKLRICAAIVHIATYLGKIFCCLWFLQGWTISFMSVFRCAAGASSLWDYLEETILIVASMSIVTTFLKQGHDWHNAHLGGWFANIAATIAWIRHCSSQLDRFSVIFGLAMRRNF